MRALRPASLLVLAAASAALWLPVPAEGAPPQAVLGRHDLAPLQEPPPHLPPQQPPPEAQADPEVAGAPRTSTKTFRSAAVLPSKDSFSGRASTKNTRLTRIVYGTMRRFVRPRVLAVACWTEADYEAVAGSAGFSVDRGQSVVNGFWLRRQPRWLHLAPWICEGVQQLFDSRQPTGRRALSLTTALHEALHAYGIRDEAMTNCFAVQLAPHAARKGGLSPSAASYLRKLALTATRRSAPPAYWNPALCRDGGEWDISEDLTLS